MTSHTEEARAIERPHRLITPNSLRLPSSPDSASTRLGPSKRPADMSALIDGMPAAISGYLTARPEFAGLKGGSDPPISEPLMKEWLDRTIAGPFDGELADFAREISHIGDKEVTFPGVQTPLPPQLVLALTAWLQGEILEAMGKTCEVATVSAAGAAWMNQFMLQLGIILEPCLATPDAPLGHS